MNIGKYKHTDQQFLYCITTLREDLLGEHPQVSSLITGVFNNRPPQPKYSFIWDVQFVLVYLKKELPKNSDLPDKPLIFKVAMLLALTSASTLRSLHTLYTSIMVKTL